MSRFSSRFIRCLYSNQSTFTSIIDPAISQSICIGNELRRLAQGIGDNIKGTNTIFFRTKQNVTFERRRDITHVQIVCDYREGKEDRNRARLVVGGEKIKSPIDCGTPTAYLFTV